MKTQTIQRQYDEVIAPHYDLDPQLVTGRSLERALDQLREQDLLEGDRLLRVLDVGIGTGSFLVRLRELVGEHLQPFGLDLSEKMVEAARRKLPDLTAEVDDAANLDAHFMGQLFDVICTHFITGFVPMSVLAPKIWSSLEVGGYWSLVGGTMAGFPALRGRARSKLMRWVFGGRELAVDDIACNPAGRDEVVETLQSNGFAVCAAETFEPALEFRNMDEFMTFAYRGGWLTPFIEALGLHQAGKMIQMMMNLFFFPVSDHHSIEIVLAQKIEK